MPSSKLSMALAPSSLLLFLVSSSVWLALSLPPLMILRVAAADGQGGEHCPPVLCGNVSISFPYGLIPEGDVHTNCGGGVEFQVRCRNNIPYLGFFQSEANMEILNIFYDNRSLLIADRPHWPPYFNRSSHEGCKIPAANTSSQLVLPLSVSPFNQSLIFYNCTKPPPSGGGLVETVCHKNTFVRAADERSDESGKYFLECCKATMMPVLGVSGKVNASNYQQLVRDGYLVTWQWPWPPPPPVRVFSPTERQRSAHSEAAGT